MEIISDSNRCDKPLVSVCMITYNQASYIREAIEGVMMQRTDYSFELIISDDCSQDYTRSICEDYREKYPDKVRLLFRDQNLGVSENFYAALFSATGKYIAFCEGDDYWIDPYKIQKQVDFLEQNVEVGCVYTDFNMYHQESGEMEKSLFHIQPENFPLHSNLEAFICHPLYFAPCTWMFRQELLPKSTLHSVDATFVLFAHMLSITEIYYLPEVTAVYRDLPESASHSVSRKKMYNRALGLYKTQLFLLDMYGISIEKKKLIDEFYFNNFYQLITIFGTPEEFKLARKVLKRKKIGWACRMRLQISFFRIGRWIIRRYSKSLH